MKFYDKGIRIFLYILDENHATTIFIFLRQFDHDSQAKSKLIFKIKLFVGIIIMLITLLKV